MPQAQNLGQTLQEKVTAYGMCKYHFAMLPLHHHPTLNKLQEFDSKCGNFKSKHQHISSISIS
jgi:hypothetical protein